MFLIAAAWIVLSVEEKEGQLLLSSGNSQTCCYSGYTLNEEGKGRPIGSSRLFEKGKRPSGCVCVFLHRHFDTLAMPTKHNVCQSLVFRNSRKFVGRLGFP